MPWIVFWARQPSAASNGTEQITQVFWRVTPVAPEDASRLDEDAREFVPSWMGYDRTPACGFREYDLLPLALHQAQVEKHDRSYRHSLEMLKRLRSQRPDVEIPVEPKLKKPPQPKSRLDRLTEPCLVGAEAPSASQDASPPKAAASTRGPVRERKPERLKKLPTKRRASQ